jgi:hypothetical protein
VVEERDNGELLVRCEDGSVCMSENIGRDRC